MATTEPDGDPGKLDTSEPSPEAATSYPVDGSSSPSLPTTTTTGTKESPGIASEATTQPESELTESASTEVKEDPVATLSAPPATTLLATAPPPPSVSPAPTTKKFASSLSVNKKFLEKSGDKGKPEPKATIARLATPPIPAPVSTSHPRLLTGKISAAPTVSPASANPAPIVSGWTKTGPAPEGAIPRVPLPSQSEQAARSGGAYSRTHGMGGFGQASAGRNGAVWGARPGGQSGQAGFQIGGDFPTAAEAAQAKQLRAAALLEQMQSRDRAVQARAAAAAATNAHLLEGLDAFRGVHLDPNASHWDEMGDEDQDFLDDTIDFGDGVVYKIDAETVANNDLLSEPHPSDFATLEAPLAPGEALPELSREERFKDDYDRTYGAQRRSVGGDAKTLFNDRLGKLEPVAGRKVDPSHDSKTVLNLPHAERARRQSITSPRGSNAALPPPTARPAWGRDSANAWGTGSAPAPRRPSIEQRARRPSIEQQINPSTSARRPSIDQGGRQLPPHLAAAQAREQARHDPASHPPSRPRAPSVSNVNVLSPPPPSAPSLKSPPQPSAPSPEAAPPPPPAPVVPDLEELHAREMHAAAERARKRRQEEETARLEQMERAKKKAAEVEEKMALAAKLKAEEEAAKQAALKASQPPAQTSNRRSSASIPNGAPASSAPPPGTDRAESSWRKPLVAPTRSTPSVKLEPTKILARDPSTPVSVAPTPASAQSTPTSILAKPAPLPPQSEVAPQNRRPPPPTVAKPASEERIWRRPDAPKQPSPPSASADVSTRQAPPHLAPPPAATLPSKPSVANPQQSSSAFASVSAPSHATSVPTPLAKTSELLRTKGNGLTSSDVAASQQSATLPKSAPKKAPMLDFEEVMSRIKDVMAVPAGPTLSSAKEVESHPTPPESSVAEDSGAFIPKVRLPSSTLTARAVPLPASAPEVAKPVIAPSARVAVGAPTPKAFPPPPPQGHIPTQPRGRAAVRKPSGRQPPSFENRDPEQRFLESRLERSLSPSPVWRVYSVKLAAYGKRIAPSQSQLASFNHRAFPHRVEILTWNPPIRQLDPRTLSRDDLLVHKAIKHGKTLNPVKVPRRTIVRKTTVEGLNAPSASALPTWQNAVASSSDSDSFFNATTAPSTESLFDLGPQRPKGAKAKAVEAKASVSFYTAAEKTIERPSEVSSEPSRSFLVTSELNGEVVEAAQKEILAAPGGDSDRNHSLPDSSFDSVEAPSSRPLSPPSAGAPWLNKSSPLTLSVLDPTLPSVWSAPPTDTPVHARARSLGGAQPENSLQGISDPDDFPAASIPTSLADLKSEDEGSIEGERKEDMSKPIAKDEARLRAAAAPFQSYNDLHAISAAAQRYPMLSRDSSHLPPHSTSPINYAAQPFLPSQPPHSNGSPVSFGPSHSPAFGPQPVPAFGHSPSPSYQTPPPPSFGPSQMYSSFGGSQGPISSYPSSHQQGYPQPSLFPSSHSPAPQPYQSYRVPSQQITNPALIASGYGFGGYGAIGGGVSRSASSLSSGYHQPSQSQPSPYLSAQQPSYRGGDSFSEMRGQYPQDGAYSIGVSPSHYAQPLPSQYSGNFSPQLASAASLAGRYPGGGDPRQRRPPYAG